MVLSQIQNLLRNEDGAVTVDWVVLTAAIVMFGVIIIGLIAPALQNTAVEIAASLDGQAS